jgi:hypothetical protein
MTWQKAVCFLVAVAALQVQGQQPVFNLGLTAGWHAAAITRRPESNRLSPLAAWGVNNAHGGAFMEIRLREPVYLLAEAQFSSLNTKGSYFVRNNAQEVMRLQASMRETALLFSTLIQYHVDNVRACVGFTSMLLQNSTLDPVPAWLVNNRRTFDFGLTTGLEVTLKPHLSVSARFIRLYGGLYLERPEGAEQARYYLLQLAVRVHIRPLGRKP